jgi:hypothetical protein
VSEFVFDDAAIVACLLRQWDVPTAMIGTAVGDDARGHMLARTLEDWGVQGEVRFSKSIKTPFEVDVSTGAARAPIFGSVARSHLDTADLSLLPVRSPVRRLVMATHCVHGRSQPPDIPVFNFEHGHADPAPRDADLMNYQAAPMPPGWGGTSTGGGLSSCASA